MRNYSLLSRSGTEIQSGLGAKSVSGTPYAPAPVMREVHNRMLHRFIPKRERIADYTADEVMIFADIINGPPCKWLGYRKDFSPPNLNAALLRDPLMHDSASVSLGAPLSLNSYHINKK